MNCRRTNTVRFVSVIEPYGEEDVRGLRAAIRRERIIGRMLEIGIVQIDVGTPVPGGRDHDDATARSEQA